ncbi:hypothetical protein BG000_010672 [Podila horticola]|nr:hypothetical protein BG000_010672 [Podila horticola]
MYYLDLLKRVATVHEEHDKKRDENIMLQQYIANLMNSNAVRGDTGGKLRRVASGSQACTVQAERKGALWTTYPSMFLSVLYRGHHVKRKSTSSGFP